MWHVANHSLWKRLLISGVLVAGTMLTLGREIALAGDDGGDATDGKALLIEGTNLSRNWAGYVLQTGSLLSRSGGVSRVSGEWTVPAVSCGTEDSYSSVWVGIDGYANDTVEQIGTVQNCRGGTPFYGSFYEMYPEHLVPAGVPVRPGDVVRGEVRYARSAFIMTLTNVTTGKSFSVTQSCSCERASAEWIVETPANNSGCLLGLADFGAVRFRKASATINGVSGDLNDFWWIRQPVSMVNLLGGALAVPSLLNLTGDSFTVLNVGA